MGAEFRHQSFGIRLRSMLKVDFHMMFTMPLVYIMVGACLVMTTMMDGSVAVDPQTGAENGD